MSLAELKKMNRPTTANRREPGTSFKTRIRIPINVSIIWYFWNTGEFKWSWWTDRWMHKKENIERSFHTKRRDITIYLKSTLKFQNSSKFNNGIIKDVLTANCEGRKALGKFWDMQSKASYMSKIITFYNRVNKLIASGDIAKIYGGMTLKGRELKEKFHGKNWLLCHKHLNFTEESEIQMHLAESKMVNRPTAAKWREVSILKQRFLYM